MNEINFNKVDLTENEVLEEVVTTENDLKKMLVDYVGQKKLSRE